MGAEYTVCVRGADSKKVGFSVAKKEGRKNMQDSRKKLKKKNDNAKKQKNQVKMWVRGQHEAGGHEVRVWRGVRRRIG